MSKRPAPTVEKFQTEDGQQWVSITHPRKGGEIAEAFPIERKDKK